jgi:cellulose synthase/poly-beta-1,6-N-acetylglucosamine synthase-like glycosyltransferase
VNLFLYILLAAPFAVVGYAYVIYPALLRALALLRSRPVPVGAPPEWPLLSISVPVHNERRQIGALIESLLAVDYPEDRRQILIISDASEDGTDDVVRSWAARGIELLRLPERSGKTAAENAAAPLLRGEIVVNTDASIRIAPGALKRLVAAFADPRVGLASGRDVSVDRTDDGTNVGEAGYVGYEMAIRALETRLDGIVGASGCFYAIRSHLHRVPLPEWLSRDFASAMIAREHGYRAVSVDDAICYVPRAPSLEREYRRKVRTMMRGMQTMHHMRHLLNPFRFGWFAWMLFSHKVCRWLVPWTGVLFTAALALLVARTAGTAWLLAGVAAASLATGAVWALQRRGTLPRPLALLAFGLAGNVAALHAALAAVRGRRNATWEPTRRSTGAVTAVSALAHSGARQHSPD